MLYFSSVFFCLSKQTDASVLMMSCLRPQASMAYAWHSHAIHHCPLYTPQTTKSFSLTCMLQTNSCRLFNMRVCALLFFRWRTLQTFACASLNRRFMKREKRGKRSPNNASDTFNGDASHSKRTMKASDPPRRLCFHHAHLYTKYPTGLKGRQPITMHQPTMYRSGPAAAGNPSRRTS